MDFNFTFNWVFWVGIALYSGGLVWTVMWWEKGAGRRQVFRYFKKKDANHAAYDYVIEPAEDGAMELKLSRAAYKKLRHSPIEGVVKGAKGSMVFRIIKGIT